MRTHLMVSPLSLAAVLSVACVAWTAPVLAADPVTGRPVKEEANYRHTSQFMVNFGIQNGGDELIGLFDSGTGEQIDSSRAGGYARLTLGGDIALGDSDFSIEVSGGLLRDGLTSNVNEDKSVFKRKVVELIPFWNFDRHRLGFGVAAHLEPVWSVNPDAGPSMTVDFKDTVGAVLQYDIRYDQNISVGARYTYITYEEDVAADAAEFDGNAIGVHVTYAF